MSDKNKVSSSGFFDPKLKIQILDTWVLENKNIGIIREKDYYKIYYFRKGKFLYYSGNKRVSVDEGTIIIGKQNDNELIKTNILLTNNYKKTEVVVICIHPTLFSNIKGDNNFYRTFIQSDCSIDNRIYTNDDFDNFDIENNIFKNIERYVKNRMGLVNFYGLISVLITELNIIFDKKRDFQFSSNSDEYMVKIFDYISSNYMCDITLENISNKFSVSKFYVEKVTNRFYSNSFHKTITNLRMWHARKLMINNKNIFLLEIAQLCGYNDYSGFYKAYSKFFNVSPKKDFEYYKKHDKFLSYEFK